MNPEAASPLGLDPVELSMLGGLILVMVVALVRRAWVRRRLRREEIDPFRVFPADTVRRPMTPSPLHGLAWAPPASELDDEDEEPFHPDPAPARVVPPPPPRSPEPAPVMRASPPPPAAPAPAVWPPAPAPRPQPTAGMANTPPPRRDPFPAPAQRPAWTAAAAAPRHDEVDEASQTIRLPTASDGTVQILPGALVMTEGPEVGKEYRFLRIGSQEVPEITVGRVSGPPYRHIQLPAATVSRMHARIRYMDGSWRIGNLSDTNPVRLNGRELRANDEIPLVDGDRLQLGEVELSYQDRRL